MRLEIQLPTPPIGYVGVELGRGQIGVAEHLLDAAQVGAALEQMRRERVPQQVWVDTLRLEPRPPRELSEEQERAGPRECAAAGIQEQLRAVALVQERPPVRQVAAQRLGGLARERDDALLAALAEHADEPVVEVDCALLESERLADPQPSAVEELHERAVAERARGRPR